MKKRLFKIVLISLAVVVIVILSAMLLITSSIGENLVRGWLENRLTVEIGLPVSIGRFETNLWSRVRIDSLAVGVDSGTGTSEETTLNVGHVRVGYSIPQLLGETVRLKALIVEGVDLAIAVDSLGRLGIPLLDDPSADTAAADNGAAAVQVDTVDLTGMSLAYHDPLLPLSVKITGAELSGGGYENGLYSGRVTVDSILGSYDSLPLSMQDFEVTLSLDSERVQIERAEADFTGLHVMGSGNLEFAEQRHIALEVSMDGSLDSIVSVISSAFGLPALSAGNLSAQLQIEGTLDEPSAKLDAHVDDVFLDNISISSAMLRAQYHDSIIVLDTFQVSVLDGIIAGTGSMSLDSLGITSANIALDDIDVASCWRLVYAEPSPYQGTVAGQIEARGQGYDLALWTADARITGTGLRYLDRSVPDLVWHTVLKRNRVEFTLNHGTDKIQADVDLSGDNLSGTFDISIPDLTALARFAGQPELSGGLWVDGTISGAYDNPVIRSIITGSGITYFGFPVDSIRAEAVYGENTVVLERLVCHGLLEKIETLNPPFDLDSISGSLEYTCEMQGTLDYLSGRFRANLRQPQYSTYGVDSVAIEAGLEGSRIELTSCDVFREGLAASLTAIYDTSSASGSFKLLLHPLIAQTDTGVEQINGGFRDRDEFGSIGGAFALKPGNSMSATVKGQGLWLGLLPTVIGDSIITDGEVEFDLFVDGPLPTPSTALSATVRTLDVADYRIDSVSTDIKLNRDALTIDDLTLYALGNSVQAYGQLELGISEDGSFVVDSNARLEGELSTSDFDLSVIEVFLPPQSEFSGIISAALQVSGTLESPSITGWLSATRGKLLLAESPATVDNIEIALSFADSVLTVDSASCTAADLRLSASGSFIASSFESVAVDIMLSVGNLGRLSVDGTASEKDLHLDVFSDSLDLAVFQPFMTGIDSLSGTLGCRILVVGEPSEPLIDGSLRLSGLSLQAAEHYVRLSGGQANVRFNMNRIILDSASAFLNDGTVRLSGSVTHVDGELADIAAILSVNNVGFQQPNVYAIVIDSSLLRYGKQNENYVLDGDIILGEARLSAGLRMTSILPWVKSVETVDLELPDLMARSRLDVRIRESDQLWVDNNLARIRLRAELGVIGTPLRPNFTGMLKIEEGYLLYLDRRFQVNQGAVYFNDPAQFNPEIDLDASTQIKVYRRTAAQPYTVYIKVEGPLDQLQYGLYSEPALEKPDIVALLTLGATRSELAGDSEESEQGGLRGVLADRVSMLTSQKVSGYLSRKAGSFFGFDEFTIQGNLFQFDDSWGPQLVASKRLSRRVDLTYSTTVGHLNDQTVRLGYRLTPRISLQGETNRQGQAGLDLKYGFTFK